MLKLFGQLYVLHCSPGCIQLLLEFLRLLAQLRGENSYKTEYVCDYHG